jgi:hypothetical protein
MVDAARQFCSIDRAGLQDVSLHSVRRDVARQEESGCASNRGCAFLAFCSEIHAHNDCMSGFRLFVIYGNKGNVSFPYKQAFSHRSLTTQEEGFAFEHNFIVILHKLFFLAFYWS